MMWQHHFEFLLLGYGAYLTFSEFLASALPDIPDQHISQMVAGIDVVLFRADTELRRLARAAIETGVDGAFVEGRTPAEIDAELATSEAGRRWLDELEQIKDPWFNMGTGDGLYHYYGSWHDDPSIPYASLIGHIEALKAGKEIERPTEELANERDRLAEEYGALLDEESAAGVPGAAGPLAHGLPVRRGAQVLLRLLVPVALLQQGARVRCAAREHGFIDEGEDIFNLSRHEAMQALEELSLTWSTGGPPLGPHHWPPIVARRRELLEQLADWTPPPALGAMPEAVNDPIVVMLWGITPQRLKEWAGSQEGNELNGAAASPGEVEGPARVLTGLGDLDTVRPGEILVCRITSPAWAPIFSKIVATVTDIGGIMSHAAIVSREYGLPAVVGTGTATSRIKHRPARAR